MIEPSPDDIGREVAYGSQHPEIQTEYGVITSFNDWFVFVRYGAEKQAKATRRSDLEWTTQPRSE